MRGTVEYEEDYCRYCNGRFVGRGKDTSAALSHLVQQLDAHEPQCLKRPENQGKKKR